MSLPDRCSQQNPWLKRQVQVRRKYVLKHWESRIQDTSKVIDRSQTYLKQLSIFYKNENFSVYLKLATLTSPYCFIKFRMKFAYNLGTAWNFLTEFWCSDWSQGKHCKNNAQQKHCNTPVPKYWNICSSANYSHSLLITKDYLHVSWPYKVWNRNLQRRYALINEVG